MTGSPLRLFEAFGVELEYMIVRAYTLDAAPIAYRVLLPASGDGSGDVERGPIAWSNELVLHVIELKTNGPAAALTGLAPLFAGSVREVNELLAPLGARLMPSAIHPWFDPDREARLWPHGYSEVYRAFDRIFDCRGHGWSNLQSAHLNLPFHGADEFGRLHAAIRLILPILPALAAASPLAEGRVAPNLDQRLEFYRHNQRRIPSLAGRVIPEPVFTPADYQARILDRLYADLAPHDPEGVLAHEWVNARGAIARFDRDTIEIRVLDVQECPAADLAIAALVIATLRALAEGRWTAPGEQQAWPVEPLEKIFLATLRDADRAVIENSDYLRQFGFSGPRASAGELWAHLYSTLAPGHDAAGRELLRPIETILERGPLARRILAALGTEAAERTHQREVYMRLCEALETNTLFL